MHLYPKQMLEDLSAAEQRKAEGERLRAAIVVAAITHREAWKTGGLSTLLETGEGLREAVDAYLAWQNQEAK